MDHPSYTEYSRTGSNVQETAVIKIAFVDSWLQASAQGTGTAMGIRGLEHALRRLGHTVVRVSPSGQHSAHLALRRLWFNLRLPRLLNQADFDLVVGFDIDGCCYAPRRRRLPFVCSIKGVLAEETRQERGTARLLLGSLSLLEKFNARKADLVLTTSEYCRRAIVHHYAMPSAKIRLVSEGIDVGRWQRLSQETPRSSDGQTILCVARQYRRKRLEDLLEALVLVRRTFSGAHAVIAGGGPEHARYCRLVRDLGLQEAVQFLGEIPDDDQVARLYWQADVFCLPSIQEGFGIVFLEAMAAGLPVVATTAAAIPEVVPHGRAGLLVPPRDPRALARALLDLLQDAGRREDFGRFGQEYVQRYDWPRVAEIFLEQVIAGIRWQHR
jgi:glycosyltransferase involved in cell wall biosynthesis